MTVLTTEAQHLDTYGLRSTFYDEDGVTLVTPNELTWSLTDPQGNVINNRSEIDVTPDTTVLVVVSGSDLDMNDAIGRIFTIEGTYNSSTLGNNRPIRRQARFDIGLWVE